MAFAHHAARRQGMLFRLFERMRPSRNRLLMGFLVIFLAQLMRMILPVITREVVNHVIPMQDYGLLLKLCAAILGVTAVRATLMYVRGILFERVSQDLVYDLRTTLYSRLQAQSFTFYDKHRIGEIMSRLTGDMEGVRGLIMNLCMGAFESLIMFVGAICFMGYFSGRLTLLLLLLCPVLAVIAWRFNLRIRPAHAAVREQNAVLNTRTQENIAGVRVVKAFAREEYEKEGFSEDNLKVLALNQKATRIWSNFHPMMDFISSLATPILLLGGGAMVAAGQIDLGTLVALTVYVFLIVNPMRMLATYVNAIAQGITSAEKLFYYMDLGSHIRDPEHPQTPAAYDGHVRFEHVTFAYGDQVVLRDIDFEAKPGETIAIMGATGSGKTTLVNLMGRFYDIREGRVLVGGVDVRRQPLQKLRRSIGYVMQESFLFSDSLSENIAFGNTDLPKDKITQAADIAQASEFITHMPQAWETVVGERGLGLSGGQRQRVSIARAIAYHPSILVLDDATSAVDMETEALIQEGLKKVMGQCTMFVIAHRISSVIHADQILVMDHGKIVERGRHADLIALGGYYYRMFMDQYRDFADLGAAANT